MNTHPEIRIKRLPSLLAALSLTAVCCLQGAATAATIAARPPNILLVLSDDHSAPHVGCYGNADIRTPNLDQFARAGMRFDRAYTAAPQCVPSRAAIMTGRSPVAIGMTRFSAPLPAEVRVFPEWLKESGYFIGVAGRTHHLDGSATPDATERVFQAHGLRTFARRFDFARTGAGGARVLQQFREFLVATPKDRPFFLQLCFNDPHRPLDRGAIPEPHDPAKLKLPPHYPDTPLVREDFARYYDEIARFDRDFGSVLAELDERGLTTNTLVIFMGDNGASQFRGKGTLNEFGCHVPLLVRWPGVVEPGRTSAELISGEDLAPTFLEAAGRRVPQEITGRSFLKLLRGEPYEARRFVFSERGAHGSGLPQNSSAFDLGRSVTTKTHRLIYTAIPSLPYWPVDFAGDPMWKELKKLHESGQLEPKLDRLYFSPTRPMFELYDLVQDPYEFNNLAGQPSATAVERELKEALQEWMILQRDYIPLPIPPPPAGQRR